MFEPLAAVPCCCSGLIILKQNKKAFTSSGPDPCDLRCMTWMAVVALKPNTRFTDKGKAALEGDGGRERLQVAARGAAGDPPALASKMQRSSGRRGKKGTCVRITLSTFSATPFGKPMRCLRKSSWQVRYNSGFTPGPSVAIQKG